MGYIFRIVMMVVALTSVVFIIYKLNTKGIDPAIFHMEPGQTLSFDADDVTHFEWRSTKKIFAYDKDKYGRWFPKKNEQSLENLLKFIAQIQLTPIEQKGASSLDVVLNVKGVQWKGSWDGLSFVWKQGPQAGKGEVLNEQKNIVFFKGSHIFETINIDLCKSRITKITLQAFGQNYQIGQVNRGWELVAPQQKTLDPIFIEKWLIGLCHVRTKSLLDLTYAQSNTKSGAVTFEFQDGQKLSLSQVAKDFFTVPTEKEEVGIILEHLGASLEDLKKELQPTTNP